jgi:hypothetical protein
MTVIQILLNLAALAGFPSLVGFWIWALGREPGQDLDR